LKSRGTKALVVSNQAYLENILLNRVVGQGWIQGGATGAQALVSDFRAKWSKSVVLESSVKPRQGCQISLGFV